MKYLKKFNENINDYLEKGDLVRLKHSIGSDDLDQNEYGFIVDKGEVGEIRYLVNDYDNPDYYNQIYMVRFPDNKEKQGSKSRGRYAQLMRLAFEKIN